MVEIFTAAHPSDQDRLLIYLTQPGWPGAAPGSEVPVTQVLAALESALESGPPGAALTWRDGAWCITGAP